MFWIRKCNLTDFTLRNTRETSDKDDDPFSGIQASSLSTCLSLERLVKFGASKAQYYKSHTYCNKLNSSTKLGFSYPDDQLRHWAVFMKWLGDIYAPTC